MLDRMMDAPCHDRPVAGAPLAEVAPRVSLMLGPGHHGERLLQSLLGAGWLHQAFRLYPHYRVEERRGAGLVIRKERRWVRGGLHLMWGLWRRLPVLGQGEAPRVLQYGLYDRLALRDLAPCDLLVGWCGVSLRCLRRARQRSAQTLLEHPTVHFAAWMDEARREYRGGGYGLLPQGFLRRVAAEIDVADAVCVPSSHARDTFLSRGVSEARLLLIPPGVDADRFRPAQVSAPRPFRVLYVGRLELQKGVPLLLRAFHRLGLRDAELWLCGRVLPEMARALSPLPGLRVLGPRPLAEMPELYRACDVLVLPSLHEGFGLVLLEALASGVPVIASRHSGAVDLVEEGVHGYLFSPRDEEALCDRLRHLHGDRDEAQRMGRAGRERVLSAYTWAHYAERVIRAYRRFV